MKTIKRPDVYRRLRARGFTAKKARRIANGNRRAFRLQPGQKLAPRPDLPDDDGQPFRFVGRTTEGAAPVYWKPYR